MEQRNPFDDEQGRFALLVNAQRQYSLWPEHCARPAGWEMVCEPQPQDACYRWLAQHWTCLQPGSIQCKQEKGIDGE